MQLLFLFRMTHPSDCKLIFPSIVDVLFLADSLDLFGSVAELTSKFNGFNSIKLMNNTYSGNNKKNHVWIAMKEIFG
jgi:hypothetical protein